LLAILTINHNSVRTKHLNRDTQHIGGGREDHFVIVSFMCDFSFTHFIPLDGAFTHQASELEWFGEKVKHPFAWRGLFSSKEL
jgi:hypothetical protein